MKFNWNFFQNKKIGFIAGLSLGVSIGITGILLTSTKYESQKIECLKEKINYEKEQVILIKDNSTIMQNYINLSNNLAEFHEEYKDSLQLNSRLLNENTELKNEFINFIKKNNPKSFINEVSENMGPIINKGALNSIDPSLEKSTLENILFVNKLSKNDKHSPDFTSVNSVLNNSVIVRNYSFSGSHFSNSYGNGTIVSPRGHIITNLHAVEHNYVNNYNVISVTRDGKTLFDAHLLAYNRKYDLALLRSNMEVDNYNPVTILNQNNLKKGTPVRYITKRYTASNGDKESEILPSVENGNYHKERFIAKLDPDDTYFLGTAFESNTHAIHGDSGGGVYDSTGTVYVGTIQSIVSSSSDSSFVSSIFVPSSKSYELIQFYLKSIDEDKPKK